METARIALLCIFALTVACTDLRHRRVPNAVILAGTACGTVLAACAGWKGLERGLAGMLLGFLLLLPAFMLRMVGGGDVKSLAVIGLLVGPHLLWVSFLRGAAVGGLVAAAFLVARRIRKRRCAGGAKGRESAAFTLPYAGILSVAAALTILL